MALTVTWAGLDFSSTVSFANEKQLCLPQACRREDSPAPCWLRRVSHPSLGPILHHLLTTTSPSFLVNSSPALNLGPFFLALFEFPELRSCLDGDGVPQVPVGPLLRIPLTASSCKVHLYPLFLHTVRYEVTWALRSFWFSCDFSFILPLLLPLCLGFWGPDPFSAVLVMEPNPSYLLRPPNLQEACCDHPSMSMFPKTLAVARPSAPGSKAPSPDILALHLCGLPN